MAEIDDWILYQSGKALGGEDIYGEVLKPEYDKYKSGYYQTPEAAQKYNTLQDELSAIGGSSSGYFNFLDKYGLSGSEIAGDATSGYRFSDSVTSANILSKTGYKPQSETDYLAGKFGAPGEYDQDQITKAQTGRYGELQGPQDLGKGWEELYQSMDKWRQQDEMWYKAATGDQGELFPRAIAHQKAAMAAGGMQAGTTLWNQNIDNLNAQRMDIEGTYQQKQEALKGSQTYQALERQYNDMKDMTQSRAIEETRTRYQNEVISHEATQKWQGARYGYDSETGQQYVITPGQWLNVPAYDEVVQTPYQETYMKETDTGDLLYGENGQMPSFDEFWQQNFTGAQDVENPYENRGISNQPESAEDKRARMAASGQVME